MRRLPYIDGLRGYLIYSMTLSHMGFMGANLFQPLSHKSVSIFFTGEGFMLLSGLMIGYIMYTGTAERGGLAMLPKSVRRSLRIAVYYLGVYVLCTLPIVLFTLPNADTVIENLFRGRDPATFSALALFVGSLYRPLLFDILFLYIIFIGLAPLLIHLALRTGAAMVLALSLFSWLCVQYGLVDKFVAQGVAVFGGDPDRLFGNFSIFAWQFPFIWGLLIGISINRDYAHWAAAVDWVRRNLVPYAFAICAAFALLRLLTTFGVISIRNVYLDDYLVLAPFTLLNFAAFSVLILHVLGAANDDPTTMSPRTRRFVYPVGRMLSRVLNTGFLRAIGANSLLTFSASVVLTYWVAFAQPWLTPLGPTVIVSSATFAAVMLILYVLSALSDLRKTRTKAQTARQKNTALTPTAEQ